MHPALAFSAALCAAPSRATPPSSAPRCAVSSPASRESGDARAAPATDKPFAAWAAANKIDMSVLALTRFGADAERAGQGARGMAATAPIRKGEQLIAVARPATLQVTSLDRRRSPLPETVAQQTWEKLPWYARLSMLLLNAKFDPESALRPWVERLPSRLETPFHWTDKELLELQNPLIVQAVREQRKLYRKLYDDINSNPDNAIARKIKYSDFVWAVECIRSRAFSGPLDVAPFKERLRLFLFILTNTFAWPALHILSWENALNGGLTALFALTMYDFLLPKILKVVQGVELKRFAMTPGIDLINHNSSMAGKAEVTYEYFTDKFVVQAGEDYEIGDQVFISYGAQSNDSLLQYYGFVETENPAETYTFGSKAEQALGVGKGSLIIGTTTGFADSTIKAVWKKLGGTEGTARKALNGLCVAEHSHFATSLEEDVEMLERGDCENDPRLKLAVRYRIEKKRVLQKNMRRL